MLPLADALPSGCAGHVSGREFMAMFEPITSQFIPLYRRIGELDPAERETSDLLVAHELALRDFARAEIAGDRRPRSRRSTRWRTCTEAPPGPRRAAAPL